MSQITLVGFAGLGKSDYPQGCIIDEMAIFHRPLVELCWFSKAFKGEYQDH